MIEPLADRPQAPARTMVPTRVMRFDGPGRSEERSLAAEVPVQVSYGDLPFGVMMLTPDDLVDFAFGFSLTEGVIERPDDIRGVAVEARPEGLHLRVDLAGPRLHAHLARRRALSGRTSCGLCGIADLAALPRASVAQAAAPAVSLAAIGRALAGLETGQPLHAATRAVHGAAWCAPDGALGLVREDVGRHNALDKLIGAILRAGLAPLEGFALITSRASFEMVEKIATFGARTLVAISAPTGLALERARALDLTLIGIARPDGVTVFHGLSRVVA